MIKEVIVQLTGAPFRQVGGAADLPESDEALKAVPAAFVLPASDRANKNQAGGGSISQLVEPTIYVMLAVSRKGAASAAALDPLEANQTAVINKLLGWQPSPEYAPFEYAGGTMMKVGKSVLWWRMAFTTQYLLRKV